MQSHGHISRKITAITGRGEPHRQHRQHQPASYISDQLRGNRGADQVCGLYRLGLIFAARSLDAYSAITLLSLDADRDNISMLYIRKQCKIVSVKLALDKDKGHRPLIDW